METADPQQVTYLADLAAGLTPKERRVFLDAKCDGDDDLRALVERELERRESEGVHGSHPAGSGGDGVEPSVLSGSNGHARELLEEGSSVGRFSIIELLGSGGMGEVYLANDPKLRRRIALKVLPQGLGSDPERLRRFEREALAISGLNHPNILTIFEFGNDGDTYYLATEYVKGESLRQLLKRRRPAIKETLNIVMQAGAALDAAHQSGIVHRDVKPENIMLRDDGIVKVLDFGLAKYLYDYDAFAPPDSDAVTLARYATVPGTLMGTVAYMSPEQARGKEVDGRSDIWSLGVVLYEMVTGRLPFEGESSSDIIASILRSEPPPLSDSLPGIPRDVEHIITKALGKEMTERYQDVKDLLLDLKLLQGEMERPGRTSGRFSRTGTADPALPATTRANIAHRTQETSEFQMKREWVWPAAATAVLAVVVVGAFFWQRGVSSDPGPPTVSQVTSWKSEIGDVYELRPKISPDGRFIAYVRRNRGRTNIRLYQIDGSAELGLRANEDADEADPVWSADSSQIAFISTRGGQTGIWAAPSLNGPVRLIAPAEKMDELVKWSGDGTKFYFVRKQNLYTLDTATKETAKLTDFDEESPVDRYFNLSPDDRRIVYSDLIDGQRDIWILQPGQEPRRVTNDPAWDFEPVFGADGESVIYSSERRGIRQIFRVPADGGTPKQLTFSNSDNYLADVSADGSKILVMNTTDDADIWRADLASGKVEQVTSDLGAEYWADISPDGNSIAYQTTPAVDTVRVRRSEIAARELGDAGVLRRLTEDGFFPQWSPDGRRVAFLRDNDRYFSIWVASAGGGDERRVTDDGVQITAFSLLPLSKAAGGYCWMPDGRTLVYSAMRSGYSNIWTTDVETRLETQLTGNRDEKLLFFDPVVSPDGSTISWAALSMPLQGTREWQVWSYRDGEARPVFSSGATAVSIIGYGTGGSELLLKISNAGTMELLHPSEIQIVGLDPESGKVSPRHVLPGTYLHSVVLSPDGGAIAFVSRENSSDELRVLSFAGGAIKAAADAGEERAYFSTPIFSPDGRSIYYSKQSRWRVISMIQDPQQ